MNGEPDSEREDVFTRERTSTLTAEAIEHLRSKTVDTRPSSFDADAEWMTRWLRLRLTV